MSDQFEPPDFEAVDPDVDLHIPDQRRELVGEHLPVLSVIGLGGGLGALARWGISQLLPTQPGGFPTGTFVINVVGCLLIGVLMVLVTERSPAHRLVRPFVGVGVLGGFTTFSTYAVEIDGLLRTNAVTAFVYLTGTALAALLATFVGIRTTRLALHSKTVEGRS
jgi:CrcB protein